MSAIGGIVFLIILARWLLPGLWSYITQSPVVHSEHARRGKVLGHRGPDVRSFKGRAGRREWWLTMLGNTVAGAIVGAVPVIGALLTLPWVIATLAVNARRLHDLSMSAWLQLVPMAFGLAFAVLLFQLGGPDTLPTPSWTLSTPTGVLTVFGAVTALVYLTFYAWIGFSPGRVGSNAYGEADPA